MRAFRLVRDQDVTGVSGTGVVAEGVEFSSGVVALTWLSEWPTSVVFHDRGMESVMHVHGHSGATRIEDITDDERVVQLLAKNAALVQQSVVVQQNAMEFIAQRDRLRAIIDEVATALEADPFGDHEGLGEMLRVAL